MYNVVNVANNVAYVVTYNVTYNGDNAHTGTVHMY